MLFRSGRILRIAKATPGDSFTDEAPLHAITTATLEHIGVEALRYRPNLGDAVVALGRWGPRHGDPHPVGLLLASVDPVALDRVACEAVGIDPARVPLIGMGAAMGLGQGDRAAITVQGADLDALSIAPIVVPDPLIPIRFSLWHNIKGLLRRWRHHGLPCCRARQ